MATGLVLTVGVDTTQAQAELESLASEIPRSMQRMVRDFDRLSKRIENIGGKGMAKTQKRMSVLQEEFSKGAAAYAASIKDFDDSVKKLHQSRAFQNLNKKQQEFMRGGIRYQRTLLEINQLTEKTLSKMDASFNPKHLQQKINKLNKAAKDLDLGININAKQFTDNLANQIVNMQQGLRTKPAVRKSIRNLQSFLNDSLGKLKLDHNFIDIKQISTNAEKAGRAAAKSMTESVNRTVQSEMKKSRKTTFRSPSSGRGRTGGFGGGSDWLDEIMLDEMFGMMGIGSGRNMDRKLQDSIRRMGGFRNMSVGAGSFGGFGGRAAQQRRINNAPKYKFSPANKEEVSQRIRDALLGIMNPKDQKGMRDRQNFIDYYVKDRGLRPEEVIASPQTLNKVRAKLRAIGRLQDEEAELANRLKTEKRTHIPKHHYQELDQVLATSKGSIMGPDDYNKRRVDLNRKTELLNAYLQAADDLEKQGRITSSRKFKELDGLIDDMQATYTRAQKRRMGGYLSQKDVDEQIKQIRDTEQAIRKLGGEVGRVPLRDLTPDMMTDSKMMSTSLMLDDRLTRAVQMLKMVRKRREQAFEEIKMFGRFSRKGLPKGLGNDASLLNAERVKQMEFLFGSKKADGTYVKSLKERFDDELGYLKKTYKDYYKKQREFITSTLQGIRTDNAYIQTVGLDAYIDKQLANARDQQLKEIKSVTDKEHGFRRVHYRQAAEDLIQYANNMDRLQNAEAKQYAKNAREKADMIRKDNSEELLDFTRNQNRYLKQYQDALLAEKRLNDDALKQAREHDRKMGLRRNMEIFGRGGSSTVRRLKDRNNEIEKEIRRSQALESGDVMTQTGGGGSGGSGRPPGSRGGDAFRAGRGGMPNVMIDRYQKSVDRLERSKNRLLRTMSMLNSVFFTFGAGLGIYSLAQYYDQWVQFSNRIKLVTNSMQELRDVQQDLIGVSNRTATSLFSSGGLFEKFSRAGDRYGVSNQIKTALTELVQQTVIISGSTTEGAKGAIIQFVQGLATELRGQELTSVREQIPRLARAIAEGLDVPISKLKQLGAQGLITGDQIMMALIKQIPKIQAEFQNVSFTITQSFELISNAMSEMIGKAMDELNASQAVSKFFEAIANYIQSITQDGGLTKLLKALFDLKEEILAIIKILGTAFLVSKGTNVLTGAAGLAGARFTGAGMNIGAAMRERGMMEKTKTLFGGGFYDATGAGYNAEERKKIMKMNEEIRQQNQKYAEKGKFNKMSQPLDIPQRRGTMSEGIERTAFWLTAFGAVLYASSESFREFADKTMKAIGEIFSKLWDGVTALLRRLDIMDTPVEAKRKEIDEASEKAAAQQRLLERYTNAFMEGQVNRPTDDREYKELLAQKEELEKKLERLNKDSDMFGTNNMRILATKQAISKIDEQLVDMAVVQGGLSNNLVGKAEDMLELSKMNWQIKKLGYQQDLLMTKENQKKLDAQQQFLDLEEQLQGMIDTNSLGEGRKRQLENIRREVVESTDFVKDYQENLVRRTRFLAKIDELNFKIENDPENQSTYNQELEKTEGLLAGVNQQLVSNEQQFLSVMKMLNGIAGGNYNLQVRDLANSLRSVLLGTEDAYAQLDRTYRDYMKKKMQLEKDREEFIDNSNLKRNQGEIDSIRAGVLKRLDQEDARADKRTNAVLRSMNESTAKYLERIPLRSAEIDRSYQLGMMKADSDYRAAIDKIRAEATNQLNKDFDFKSESEIDLIGNPSYRKKVRETFNEYRTQIQQLINQRKRSVAELERESEISGDLLGIQEETLKIARQGGSYLKQFREKGTSDAMAQIMEQEKSMQTNLMNSLADYMVTTGRWVDGAGEKFMQQLSSGGFAEALTFLENAMEAYRVKGEAGDEQAKEYYLNLKRITEGVQTSFIATNIQFQQQLDGQLANLQEANRKLQVEAEIYLAQAQAFFESDMKLGLNDSGDPVTQAASSLLSQLRTLRGQRTLLVNERDRTSANLAGAKLAGDEDKEALLRTAVDVKNQEITNNKQQESNLLVRESSQLLKEVSIQQNIIHQDRSRYIKQESVLNDQLFQQQVDQLDLEHERTGLMQKRVSGIQLNRKESERLYEIEKELSDSSITAKRLSRENELQVAKQRQIDQSRIATDLLKSQTEDAGVLKNYSQAQEVYEQNVSDLYRLQLLQLGDLLKVEEELAQKRRENAIEAKLLQSGLFTTDTLGSFTGSKSMMAQLLEDPIFGPMASKAGDARRFVQDRNSPLNQFSIDALLGQSSEIDEATGLFKDPEIRKILTLFKMLTSDKNELEEETLRKTIISKRQQLQDMADIEDLTRRSESILSNSTRSSDKVIQLLEDQRKQGQQQLEISFLTDVALQAIEENVKIGSERYQEIYREKRRQFDLNSMEELFRLDRQFVQGIRDEYKYLESEIFDLTSMSEQQLITLAPLMQGLQKFTDIERKVKTPASATPEMRLIEAESIKKKELAKVDAALREGRYKDLEVLSQNIIALDLYIQRIQVSAESIGIYTEELTKATKANMQLQLEQSINSMQNSEREMQVQLEMAQLRKEAILTESQLAEVEAGKRKILAQQEIADQEEILYLQTQQKLAALEVAGYDPNSPENIGKRQQIEAEYLQQSRLLSLQERQQLAAIDAQEQLRKLNEEQNKSLNEMEGSLGRILGTYFSFVGNIFGTIFDAIFGSAKKQEDFNPAKLAEDRIKQLERDKKEIENEINFVLEPNAEHYVNNTEALRASTKALNDNTRAILGGSGGSTKEFETGGLLHGPTHDQGGIDMGRVGGVKIEAEGGEYIIRKSSVSKLGLSTLNYINEHGHLPYESDIFKTSSMMSVYQNKGGAKFSTDEEGNAVAKFSEGTGWGNILDNVMSFLSPRTAQAGTLATVFSESPIPKKMMKKYLKSEKRGDSAADMFVNYGIFRGVDGLLRYHVPIKPNDFKEEALREIYARLVHPQLEGLDSLMTYSGDELLKSSAKVFEHYPMLARTDIAINKDPDPNQMGFAANRNTYNFENLEQGPLDWEDFKEYIIWHQIFAGFDDRGTHLSDLRDSTQYLPLRNLILGQDRASLTDTQLMIWDNLKLKKEGGKLWIGHPKIRDHFPLLTDITNLNQNNFRRKWAKGGADQQALIDLWKYMYQGLFFDAPAWSSGPLEESGHFTNAALQAINVSGAYHWILAKEAVDRKYYKGHDRPFEEFDDQYEDQLYEAWKSRMMSTLVHEMQHLVQERDQLPTGAPSSQSNYWRTAGEWEARYAAFLTDMSSLKKTSPEDLTELEQKIYALSLVDPFEAHKMWDTRKYFKAGVDLQDVETDWDLKMVVMKSIAEALGSPADSFMSLNRVVGDVLDGFDFSFLEKNTYDRMFQHSKFEQLMSQASSSSIHRWMVDNGFIEDRPMTVMERRLVDGIFFGIKNIAREPKGDRMGYRLKDSFFDEGPKRIEYANGGMLTGPSHAQGGIRNLELEGGEYIIKKSSVDRIGKGALDYVNASGDLPSREYAKGGFIEYFKNAHKQTQDIEDQIREYLSEVFFFDAKNYSFNIGDTDFANEILTTPSMELLEDMGLAIGVQTNPYIVGRTDGVYDTLGKQITVATPDNADLYHKKTVWLHEFGHALSWITEDFLKDDLFETVQGSNILQGELLRNFSDLFIERVFNPSMGYDDMTMERIATAFGSGNLAGPVNAAGYPRAYEADEFLAEAFRRYIQFPEEAKEAMPTFIGYLRDLFNQSGFLKDSGFEFHKNGGLIKRFGDGGLSYLPEILYGMSDLSDFAGGRPFSVQMWPDLLAAMHHHGIDPQTGELGQRLYQVMMEKGLAHKKKQNYRNNLALLDQGSDSFWYTAKGLLADVAGGAGDIGSLLQFALWESLQNDGRGMWDKFTDTMTDGSWFFNSHSVEMSMRKSGFMEDREATTSETIGRIMGNFLIPSGLPKMMHNKGTTGGLDKLIEDFIKNNAERMGEFKFEEFVDFLMNSTESFISNPMKILNQVANWANPTGVFRFGTDEVAKMFSDEGSLEDLEKMGSTLGMFVDTGRSSISGFSGSGRLSGNTRRFYLTEDNSPHSVDRTEGSMEYEFQQEQEKRYNAHPISEAWELYKQGDFRGAEKLLHKTSVKQDALRFSDQAYKQSPMYQQYYKGYLRDNPGSDSGIDKDLAWSDYKRFLEDQDIQDDPLSEILGFREFLRSIANDPRYQIDREDAHYAASEYAFNMFNSDNRKLNKLDYQQDMWANYIPHLTDYSNQEVIDLLKEPDQVARFRLDYRRPDSYSYAIGTRGKASPKDLSKGFAKYLYQIMNHRMGRVEYDLEQERLENMGRTRFWSPTDVPFEKGQEYNTMIEAWKELSYKPPFEEYGDQFNEELLKIYNADKSLYGKQQKRFKDIDDFREWAEENYADGDLTFSKTLGKVFQMAIRRYLVDPQTFMAESPLTHSILIDRLRDSIGEGSMELRGIELHKDGGCLPKRKYEDGKYVPPAVGRGISYIGNNKNYHTQFESGMSKRELNDWLEAMGWFVPDKANLPGNLNIGGQAAMGITSFEDYIKSIDENDYWRKRIYSGLMELMKEEGFTPKPDELAQWKTISYEDDDSLKHEIGHAFVKEMKETVMELERGNLVKQMFDKGNYSIPLKKEMLSFYHYQRSGDFIDWEHPQIKKYLDKNRWMDSSIWPEMGLKHPRGVGYSSRAVPEELFVEYLGEFLTRPDFLAENYPEIYSFLKENLPRQKFRDGTTFLDHLKDHPNMSKHMPMAKPLLPPALPDMAVSALKKAAPLAMPAADGVGLPSFSKPKKAPKHSDDKSYWDIFLEYLPFLDFFSSEKHATGGYLRGPSHAQGGIDLGVLGGVRHEAEGGEYIIRKEAVQRLGVNTLDHMNEYGNLPRNRRFHRGGPAHGHPHIDAGSLSLYPIAHTEPTPNAMEILSQKPDNSAAKAKIRKAIYEGIKAGAEAAIREREEAKELQTLRAVTNIQDSFYAHLKRREEFLEAVDLRVQEKIDRINQSELALVNIQSEHAKNNILAARDSAQQRTLAISESKNSYEKEQSSAYLAFANAGESQRRMAQF